MAKFSDRKTLFALVSSFLFLYNFSLSFILLNVPEDSRGQDNVNHFINVTYSIKVNKMLPRVLSDDTWRGVGGSHITALQISLLLILQADDHTASNQIFSTGNGMIA